MDFSDQNLLEQVWIEKYRPRTLEDVKLEDLQKKFLYNCIKKKEIPHLLFFGPPGGGKTTIALIIKDNLISDRCDCLTLNGSSDRGIDVVRNAIEPYLRVPANSSNHKIVFIDEFDYMTREAQESLRNIMEKYISVGRFLCTGNYASKIEPALISRFQKFEMKTIPESFALDYCEKILKSENIEYDKQTVELVIKTLIPDIRQIINTLQQNIIDKKLSGINKDKLITLDKKLAGLVCRICDSIGKPESNSTINYAIPEIENSFSEGEPDYISVYTSLSRTKIPPWAKIVINKYCNMHNSCAIPSIHFVAMVFEIIQTGQAYYHTFSAK
jgi:DNA polymerase III delta prime subunit